MKPTTEELLAVIERGAVQIALQRAEAAEARLAEAEELLRTVADTADSCYVPPPTIRAARAFLAGRENPT